MTREPRILVGVTTYEKKDYIFHKCMESIYAQDYPNFEVMIVDNSATMDYFAKLKRRGYKGLYRTQRGANSRVALTKAQNRIRLKLLEGDYDYLLFVESDLILPQGTIRRLLSYHKPIVGSIYFIGTGEYKVPCVFLNDVQKQGFMGTRPIGLKVVEGQENQRDPDEVLRFLNTGLRECHGCGFGCTLIERRILEDNPFWCDIRFTNKHSDVYFYLDMQRRRIPVFVDTNITIPHYPIDWATVLDR